MLRPYGFTLTYLSHGPVPCLTLTYHLRPKPHG